MGLQRYKKNCIYANKKRKGKKVVAKKQQKDSRKVA